LRRTPFVQQKIKRSEWQQNFRPVKSAAPHSDFPKVALICDIEGDYA